MHRKISIFNLLLSLVFIVYFGLLSTCAQYPSRAKILTYNIYAMGHGDNSYDDVVKVLDDIKADISGHQEVDSANGRNPLDVIGWLGNQTNTHSIFAPALKNWGGGAYGEGLLSIKKPINVRKFWVDQSGGEDRSAIEIEITMGGEKVRVLTTHLAHENGEFREYQAKEMVKWIDAGGSRDIPMIIMGDFNARPGSGAMKQYEDAGFIYVRNKDGEVMDNIDHIMYRPKDKWRVIESDKPTGYPASDHDPVWAIMELINTTEVKNDQEINYATIKLISNSAIQFNLNEPSEVSAMLYTSSGQKVGEILPNSKLPIGHHIFPLTKLIFNSGVYFLKCKIDNHQITKKIVLVQ